MADTVVEKTYVKENIFKEANHLEPKEWLLTICNKSLNAKDFIEYLTNKYKEIYQF